jgi:hypothetical protein
MDPKARPHCHRRCPASRATALLLEKAHTCWADIDEARGAIPAADPIMRASDTMVIDAMVRYRRLTGTGWSVADDVAPLVAGIHRTPRHPATLLSALVRVIDLNSRP